MPAPGATPRPKTNSPNSILPGTFDLGFTAGLMLKDVNLFLAEREVLGVPTTVIEAVARLLAD